MMNYNNNNIVLCGNSIEDLENGLVALKSALATGAVMGVGGSSVAEVEAGLDGLCQMVGADSCECPYNYDCATCDYCECEDEDDDDYDPWADELDEIEDDDYEDEDEDEDEDDPDEELPEALRAVLSAIIAGLIDL